MMLLWTFLLLIPASTYAAPVSKGVNTKVVDLSYVYDDKVMYFPAPSHPKMTRELISNYTLPDGARLPVYKICSAEHGGTHIDAPSHFEEKAWELDQIPLDHLMGRPLVVVNITERALTNPNTMVEVSDMEEWEKQNGPVPEGAVVFMNSGWGRYWGNETAFLGNETPTAATMSFPGFSAETAKWLLTRKVTGIGSDTLSFDVGSSTEYPVHKILLPANVYGMENVANVDKLPPAGATVYIAPLKITRGTGAPARIYAEFPVNE